MCSKVHFVTLNILGEHLLLSQLIENDSKGDFLGCDFRGSQLCSLLVANPLASYSVVPQG